MRRSANSLVSLPRSSEIENALAFGFQVSVQVCVFAERFEFVFQRVDPDVLGHLGNEADVTIPVGTNDE